MVFGNGYCRWGGKTARAKQCVGSSLKEKRNVLDKENSQMSGIYFAKELGLIFQVASDLVVNSIPLDVGPHSMHRSGVLKHRIDWA